MIRNLIEKYLLIRSENAAIKTDASISNSGLTASFDYSYARHLYESLGVGAEMESSKIKEIIEKVRDHSMVHETGIEFTIASVLYTIKQDIPGVFVEFGTWRGGCSVAMLLAQRAFFGRVLRPVYMFDSFEGLPRVSDKDGPLAEEYQRGVDLDNFRDNCRAAQEDLEELLSNNGFSVGEYFIERGWFSDTVSIYRSQFEQEHIAILRLDGDWYDSTEIPLQGCCPSVSEEGIVIIDDYYAWDGCARATHDYLSNNDFCYRIKSLPYNFGGYFIKRNFRKSVDQF